jgi:hypothetical protein
MLIVHMDQYQPTSNRGVMSQVNQFIASKPFARDKFMPLLDLNVYTKALSTSTTISTNKALTLTY